MSFEKSVDKIVDNIFSMKKTTILLLSIFILGLILRIVAANNLTVGADDMHHTIFAIDFLKSGKMTVYDQSTGLWYGFTNIMYNFLGINQLSSRLAAVIFGSFSIIIIFLLAKELIGEKTGLIAALLLAVSPFHIKNTLGEQDVMAMFFVLFAIFLFIKFLKDQKSNKYLILSATLLGLSILVKLYALVFIPILMLYALYLNYQNKKKIIDPVLLKKLFLFGFICFIFFIPALTHNYLLYKDKGFLDLHFTRVFNLGRDVSEQYYGWDATFTLKADWKRLVFGDPAKNRGPTFPLALSFVLLTDPIVFILGILGLLYLFVKKRNLFVLFFLLIIVPLLYLASVILLEKHYIFLTLFLVTPASIFLLKINERIKKKIKGFKLKYLAIPILIFTLILLGFQAPHAANHVYSKSEVAQTMSYISKTTSENDLIIADARIYRGKIHWLLNTKNYAEATYFQQIIDASEQSPGQKVPLDVYYIECVIDDCGWGTVKNQPEFNASMEMITDFFKTNSEKVKEIYSPKNTQYQFPISAISEEKNHYYNIYKTQISINPAVIPSLKSTKVWFLYPIGYDESIQPIFDKYTVNSLSDKLIDRIAHFIFYVSLILSFIVPFIALYFLFMQPSKTPDES